jgi:adenylate cyclase
VSVLFSDIRGFTALSERYSPEEVMSLLNEYLPHVVQAAHTYGGTVNKFGGDSTLIVYGAPRPMQDSAQHAIQTALLMRTNLACFNDTLADRGFDPLKIGIGINTGEVLAGALGSEDRQEYTVIGDTVNLASRIEALNKQYPDHDILISQWTYEALGEKHREFELVHLGEIPIRGKQEPVSIWSVVGLVDRR